MAVKFRRLAAWACASASVVVLANCGGGGGGSSAQSPTSTAAQAPATIATQATAATCDAAMKTASENPPPNTPGSADPLVDATLSQCPSKSQWLVSVQPYVGTDFDHSIVITGNTGAQRDRDIVKTYRGFCRDANGNVMQVPACVNP
jgi:hypothetical protein